MLFFTAAVFGDDIAIFPVVLIIKRGRGFVKIGNNLFADAIRYFRSGNNYKIISPDMSDEIIGVAALLYDAD